MRTKPFVSAVFIFNAVLLVFYVNKQVYIEKTLAMIEKMSNSFEEKQQNIMKDIEDVIAINRLVKQNLTSQGDRLRSLLEYSRRNFIRIKGIKEKPDENLEEKIIEMAAFLDVDVSANDIERVNRIGVKKERNERIIVAELSNYKIKQKLLRKASAEIGKIKFSIHDDVGSYIAPIPKLRNESPSGNKTCANINFVEHPITHSKSSTIFGAWMKDPLGGPNSPIYVMKQIFENRFVEEYGNIRDVVRWKPRLKIELPYEWAGTGHVIYDHFLYFNKFNSNAIVKFDLKKKSIEAEKILDGAAFANQASYQWSGATDIDLAVDEMGLWVIYATPENGMDIVISKLNTVTLEVEESWRTNIRKQWCGNAFMACGVLYVLKKYNEAKTILSYKYNTKNRRYKRIEIPIQVPYQWNTMLAYNHVEKKLYSWDRGYLLTYNVSFIQS